MFRHVVAHVEVDRHTHQGLKLVFEAGDVEQGDFAEHCWKDGGEQIEVTPFVIIASCGRAEEFGLNEAICVLQPLPMMFLRREEQYLGVVKQLLLLFDRHHWQISACHGDPPMIGCMHIQSQP
ncbi:hypothetical protein ALP84_200062 [Pseudomonas cichorii]|uniref:Uncharacterized protein n=1 Tax=Pseudomonas cichorii TaxID=36746 RepID=A0A3M4WF88_PSECI|nr:hypothetical protein ALP84_200062 [Pseudomonas cichorii]